MASNPPIWTAWFQGRRQAPRHVQRIFRLWEDLNPDRCLHVVEDAEAESILERVGVHQKQLSPQAKADIVRLILLKERGGVWVDSTLLPTAPLSGWIEELTARAGFFAFRSTGDPNLVLQTWFLASPAPDNLLVSRWCDLLVDYFRTPRCWANWKRAVYHARIVDYWQYSAALHGRDTLWFADPDLGRHCFFHPYMATNYNLAYLLKSDPCANALWKDVPVYWHTVPELAGHVAADPETSASVLEGVIGELLPHSPVHKLNHRDPRFDVAVTCARALAGLHPDAA